jgi:hypothetical protein
MSDFFDALQAVANGLEADVVLDDMRRPVGRIVFVPARGDQRPRAFVQVWGPVFADSGEVRAAIGEAVVDGPGWRTEAVAKALAQLRPGAGVEPDWAEPDWALAAFIGAGRALMTRPEYDYADALEAQGLQVQYVL